MLPIVLILFLFLFPHPSPPVNSQLLPIINEGGGIDPNKIPIYIIHVEKPRGDLRRSLQFSNLKNWYMTFLPNDTLSSGEPRLVYAYREVISGFAARLTPNEVEAMKSLDGFIMAYPEKEHDAFTTYTPTFLSLKGKPSVNSLWADTSMGAGQIIGVIDSGIDNTHPSFKDDGMPSAPSKWKGSCFWSKKRTCNNKLLGAVALHNGAHLNPYDDNGHGTHVASTAAGNFVENANVIGQAKGTASGMAPRAHLAIYKVFFKDRYGRSGATDADILAAIDQAIHDQVDILQMSLGINNVDLFRNSIAIGSFAAIGKGIVPCAAAGNSGPTESNLANDAPWILTVGASTTDRRIKTSVLLGDGSMLDGESANQKAALPLTQLPLAFPFNQIETKSSFGCTNINELKRLNISGKIVMCYRSQISDETRGRNVMNAGGVSMILLNTENHGETTNAFTNVLPASQLNWTSTMAIIKYYRNTKNPTAKIKFGGTQFGINTSPSIASFSSRGPSLINGGILKPDVIAPGVNILAAWPQPPGSTSSNFNFLSGTSMATPHVSGIVALLRKKHQNLNLTPASIKSMIMTTAYGFNREGNPITDEYKGNVATAFARGAGHINPEAAAANPRIIYEIDNNHYVDFLCGLYESNEKKVSVFTKKNVNCAQMNAMAPEQLNYPSFSVSMGKNKAEVRVTRKVTNVGDAKSSYSVDVKMPEGVLVEVSPKTIDFNKLRETKSYEVKFKLTSDLPNPKPGKVKEGQLMWISGKYSVISPIIIMFV